jgi:hypothetical protein
MHIWDVDAWLREISLDQLKRWMAFYNREPWGDTWRMVGRAVSLLRAAWGARYDEKDEERFRITYRPGDELRPRMPQTDAEIRRRLARMPGMRMKPRE